MCDESWIDKSIVLDFKIPKDIQYILDLCEQLNDQHDYAYFGWAEGIDDVCKEAYRRGHMSKKQWDLILRRYHL